MISVLCLSRCCVVPAILLPLFPPLPSLHWLSSPLLLHPPAEVVVTTMAPQLPLPGKFGLGLWALASAAQALLRSRAGRGQEAECSLQVRFLPWRGGLLFQECLSKDTYPTWEEAKAELCSGECPVNTNTHFPGRILP